MRIRVCDWSIANAMVDGWGDEPSEVHCRACTLAWVAEYFVEYADEQPTIDNYMDSAHRGGFVPAIVDGFICDHCGKRVDLVA